MNELRRAAVKLSLLGAPLLLRCAEAPAAPRKDDRSDGRLRARIRRTISLGTPTPKPEPLGLTKRRDGMLYVPKAREGVTAAALLLYLHGATGSGAYAMPRLMSHADSTGTIILAPDSRSRTWGIVDDNADADIEFLDAALQKVFDNYAVDARRIGIAGFSDGASAALSFGLVNGDLFTGIAAFSPGFVVLMSDPVGGPRIFISHGVDDQILPIDRCGRRIARELKRAGYTVDYREFEGDHTVPPEIRDAGLRFLL